jgi:hypothetical protein
MDQQVHRINEAGVMRHRFLLDHPKSHIASKAVPAPKSLAPSRRFLKKRREGASDF